MNPVEMVRFVGGIKSFKNSHPELIRLVKEVLSEDLSSARSIRLGAKVGDGDTRAVTIQLSDEDLDTVEAMKEFVR